MATYIVTIEDFEVESVYRVLQEAPSIAEAKRRAEDKEDIGQGVNARSAHIASPAEIAKIRSSDVKHKALIARINAIPRSGRFHTASGSGKPGRRGTNHVHPAGPRKCPKCGV